MRLSTPHSARALRSLGACACPHLSHTSQHAYGTKSSNSSHHARASHTIHRTPTPAGIHIQRTDSARSRHRAMVTPRGKNSSRLPPPSRLDAPTPLGNAHYRSASQSRDDESNHRSAACKRRCTLAAHRSQRTARSDPLVALRSTGGGLEPDADRTLH